MFQTFEAPQGGQDSADRMARLRELMVRAVAVLGSTRKPTLGD